MKLLILGGTKFLGRNLVEVALARGDEVTLFNRGQTNSELYSEVEKIRGDRDGGLAALGKRTWDAVIDPSGYVPRLVGASAEALRDRVQHYTFISSCSVYADATNPGVDENAPVGTIADESFEEITGESYGPLKALSEQAAERAMPGRVLAVRAGLIVGPYDSTDRFPYWPRRVGQGGEVLAPGKPEAPVMFIDARDLASWILRMAEAKQAGTFNATGPDYVLSMAEHLDACKRVTKSDATFTWVDEAFLLEHKVAPYAELPLWVPEAAKGFNAFDCRKAWAAGLTFRALEETIRDTWRWDVPRTEAERNKYARAMIPPPITREREFELLKSWKEVVKAS